MTCTLGVRLDEAEIDERTAAPWLRRDHEARQR